MATTRLAIVTTHPIQYYAPVFRALSESGRVEIRVFYTWSQAAANRFFDPGFGAVVEWDIPLLEGYPYQFVDNVAKHPGLHHFRGLHTPSLVQEIERWRADAVLVYTWNSRSHLQALRYFKGRLPVLFRGDSTLLDPRPWWRNRLRRLFLTWVYSHVDIAVAVGCKNQDYFAWCGLPPNRIAVAPHSVDTVRFSAQDEVHDNRARDWREQLGIDGESMVVLFAGKLQGKKNPTLLLESFPNLEGAHLVFVGNGELEESLKSRASGMSNVHFMPFQNQAAMPAVYRLGDVFVLPSQGPEETWGLALNEAMASGRPVIASSRVGGACDLIRPYENGWVFTSGRRDELNALLRGVMAMGRSELRAMGRAAQRHVQEFSSEASARRIADAVLDCRAAGIS